MKQIKNKLYFLGVIITWIVYQYLFSLEHFPPCFSLTCTDWCNWVRRLFLWQQISLTCSLISVRATEWNLWLTFLQGMMQKLSLPCRSTPRAGVPSVATLAMMRTLRWVYWADWSSIMLKIWKVLIQILAGLPGLPQSHHQANAGIG